MTYTDRKYTPMIGKIVAVTGWEWSGFMVRGSHGIPWFQLAQEIDEGMVN